MKVYLVTLGCPKNEVDSAGMAWQLERAGHRLVERPQWADVLIVNTCGFIAPAREESLGVLRELAEDKRPGQHLVAAGCMAGLYADQLRGVSGVDALLDTLRWPEIVQLLQRLEGKPPAGPGQRILSSSEAAREGIGLSAAWGGSAYLKIADGCDARCAFCTIPRIKGPYRSVPQENLLAEARVLVEAGVREIILIAQDTTAYGRDWGLRDGLAELLEALLRHVPELPWLRLMYTYPGRITPRLVEVLASHPQICPYLDIPLQHAHPDTLRRMGRPADPKALRGLLRRLRRAIPDLVLRTTLIVGYPGETEQEFAALRDLVLEQAFERLGIFPYYREAGTPAAELPEQVPAEVALARRDELMQLQQQIVQRWGERQVGRTVEVLVEGVSEEGITVGRSHWDAPEVDGLVLAQGQAEIGSLVPVRIDAASVYDLWGTVVEE
ncbi:MAG: 30S ribosomal protein S12 methylthiotransferase RimO [Chloroflexia bacterium]|nr:30S ribosomal protein S12 methylthiotransferase RimO [Chloroflexia bacterium]